MRHASVTVFAAIGTILLVAGAGGATVYTWEEPSGVLVMTNDERDLPADPARVRTQETAPPEGTDVEKRGANADVRDGDDRTRAGSRASDPVPSTATGPAEESPRSSDAASNEVSRANAEGERDPSNEVSRANAEGERDPPAVRDSTLALYALLRDPPPRDPPAFIVSVVPDSGRPLSTSGEVGSGETSSRLRSGSADRRAPQMNVGRGPSMPSRSGVPSGMVP